jgi:molybdate transport system substrate-binding protein
MIRSLITGSALALICLVAAVSARAVEVKVLSANVFTSVLDNVASDFQQSSGHTVTIVYATAGVVRSRVQSGEFQDAIILPRPMMEELAQQGMVVRGSIINVAHSAVGVAVRNGTPKPDIGSVEAFKRSLLAAQTISYANPARGGATGVLVTQVFKRLGITEEMAQRTRLPPGDQFAVEVVARGEAELALAQPMEVLGQPGGELVGLLPAELQAPANFTFSAAVSPSAKNAEAAHAFVQYLSEPAAAAVFRAKGMTPG